MAHASLLHVSQLKWLLDPVFAIGRLRHASLSAVGTLREENIRILAAGRIALCADSSIRVPLLRRFGESLVTRSPTHVARPLMAL